MNEKPKLKKQDKKTDKDIDFFCDTSGLRLEIAAQILAAKLSQGDRVILDNAVDNSLIAADLLISKNRDF